MDLKDNKLQNGNWQVTYAHRAFTIYVLYDAAYTTITTYLSVIVYNYSRYYNPV